MKLQRLSALALVAAALLTGCDTSPTAGNDNTSNTLPAGARILTVSGKVKDSTGNVRVNLRHKTVKPDASGNYTIVDTIVPFAARQAVDPGSADAAPTDTARIIVITPSHTDTLREVPLTSWSTILTPLSVVANDISVNAATGSRVSGKIVEAVWWADDSIAHVLRVPNSTSADYFSTTIYTLYNDSAYAVNGHKYFIFLRAKTKAGDTLPVAATLTRDIGAQNGALNYTDTFFHVLTVDSVSGSMLVPGDSNVVKYSIKHAITPPDSLVQVLDTIYGVWRGFVDSVPHTLSAYARVTVSFDLSQVAGNIPDSIAVYTNFGKVIVSTAGGAKSFTIPRPRTAAECASAGLLTEQYASVIGNEPAKTEVFVDGFSPHAQNVRVVYTK